MKKVWQFFWYHFFLAIEIIVPHGVAAYNSSFTGRFQGKRKFKETDPKSINIRDHKKYHFGFLSTRHGKIPN